MSLLRKRIAFIGATAATGSVLIAALIFAAAWLGRFPHPFDAARRVIGGVDFAPPLAVQSTAMAPYLGIPAVVERPNAATLRPYFADRAGLKVHYLRNIFSTNEPDLVWVPVVIDGKTFLPWQTYDAKKKSGLFQLFPGNDVTLVDNVLYDFGIGTLFVKVNLKDNIGFMLLETLTGETEPDLEQGLIVANNNVRFLENASVELNGIRLYEQTVRRDYKQLLQEIDELAKSADYAKNFSSGQSTIHPLLIASTTRSMLFSALRSEVDAETRQAAIASAETFVREYITPEKTEIKPGIVSWPYRFPWTTNWGIKLTPPWYSPFMNAEVVEVSALLYQLTGNPQYATLAQQAMPFITTPIDEGGSEYQVAGFRLPAEYVYPTPPLPNIRVLDGEFGVAIAIYNGARLLGDSRMLESAERYLASLSMQLESYTTADGDLLFAQYVETLPESYRWPVWALLQDAAIVTKDRRFSRSARQMTPRIGKYWCEHYGC